MRSLYNPTGFHLTAGQVNDLEGAERLMPDLLEKIQVLLGDQAFVIQA
jgi:hypothetical protein